MASRIANKPDPQIRKNVLRARASAHRAHRAHASVVAASMAATLCTWVLFSAQDAQVMEAARAANCNQAALTTLGSPTKAPSGLAITGLSR